MTRVTRLWILWASNVIVTLTFAITVLMISSRSEAKVIYSAVDVTVNNGHIKIDLNHDGTRDFDIQAAASGVYCGTGSGGVHAVVTVTPNTGDGVVASGGNAAALASGIRVGPGVAFYKSRSEERRVGKSVDIDVGQIIK